MDKKYIVWGILLIIIIGGIFFNRGASQSQSRQETVDLVVTDVGFNPIFYPIDNKKVLQPEDIQINIKTADYTQAELYTLASSDHPLVGVLSTINIGIAHNRGEEFKVLVPYYREIVGPGEMSVGQLIIMRGSDIKTAQDLYEKKVGIQGETDGSTIALKTVLKNKYNLDLSKINFAAYDSELMPELLSRRAIDAAMVDSDYILASDFDQNFTTLVDFGKDLQELYGVVPPVKFFVVKSELYEKDPQLYEKVVGFFRKNYEWSIDNIEEITRLEAVSSGEDYASLIKALDYQSRLDKLTRDDIKALEAIYQTAKEIGVIEEIPDVDKLFEVREN